MTHIQNMVTDHGNKRVSDEEILKTIREINGPFVTAGELAEELPIGRHAINKRLKKLLEDGQVNRKKASGQWIGWWIK